MKNCIQCNKELENKRSDAKYCCSTCKGRHFENKKAAMLQEQGNKISNTLRGVISSNTETPEKKIVPLITKILIPIETNEYKELKNRMDAFQTSKKRLEWEIKQLQSNINEIESNGGKMLTLITTLSSAAVAYEKTKNVWSSLLFGSIGYGAGRIINSLSDEKSEQNKQFEVAKLKSKICLLNVSLTSINMQIGELNTKMIGIKRYDFKHVPNIPMYIKKAEIESTKPVEIISSLPEITNPTEVNLIKESRLVKKTEPIKSDKILCSLDLQKFEYKALKFQGKWLEFLGLPSINFHLVLHGMSGEGKSTFAIQFAKYLAQNFGKVIYVSGEEGFAKTFNDKLTNNDAACPDLFVADLHSFEDIIRDVPADTYNFIFFDSLDDMGIDAKKMKELRKIYKDSALITISQSTKDGKMRGSNQITHDSDMAVKVDNGIATTTKNRFKQKGMKLTVFESLDKK